MAKLLDVDVQVRLPAGAVASPVIVEYPEAYRVGAFAAGGDFEGLTSVPDANGWATLKNKAGDGPLRVYGGELGDTVPPLVTIRIRPRGADVRSREWVIEGHPRETVAGKWDGSRIGEVGPTLATPEQLTALGDVVALQGDLEQALADIAQSLAETEAALAQVAPLSGESYPNGSLYEGVEVAWGFDDPNDRFWFFFTPGGQMRVPGGIDLSAATGISAEQVSGGEVAFVGGYEAAPVVQDSAGYISQAQLLDGRMYFPGGILAPGLGLDGMTTDSDGGLRLNGVRIGPRADLVGIGDSMTAAGYTARVATLLGVDSYNLGIGGQVSSEIAARVDAGPVLYANVSGGSIPASGPVTVDMVAVDVLRNGANQSMPVWIAGVHGTLSRVGTANAATQLTGYTFARTVAGAAVAVTNPVQVRPDMTVKEDCTALIRVGRNDVPYTDAVDRTLDGVRRIVARLGPAKRRFLILDVLTAVTEGSDASGGNLTQRQRVLAINEALRREWPYQYVPLRAEMVRLGGAANDTITSAQSGDGVHLTAAADQDSAVFVARQLRERGWYV